MSSIGRQIMPESLAAPTSIARPLQGGEPARLGHPLALAVFAAALYYAAAELGLALRFPGLAVSAIWPPNAVLLTALLLTSPRHWWIPLLAIVPAHFAANADAGFPAWRLLWQIGLNWTLTACAAGALRALVGTGHPFGTLRDLAIYLAVAVIAVPAAVSLLAPNAVMSMLDAAAAQPTWLAWRSAYLSNAMGFLTLVPAMVLWASEGAGWVRRARLARCAEAALVGVGIYVICSVVLAAPAAPPALLYTPLPLLLWAATRFGVAGVASALFALALLSISCAVAGHGPFTQGAAIDNVFRLQMFLFAMAAPLLILAMLMDERARAAAAIRTGQQALRESFAQVRDLAGRLITAQETERTRIARDLHDDVGQRLAAVAIGLSQVRQRVRDNGSAETTADIERLQAGVNELAHVLRDLSHELHPTALRHLGLGGALRGHCREFARRHGIEVDFEDDSERRRVPPCVALCLFRVAQEALRNVARHAQAGRVWVRLANRGDTVKLVIDDDGRGFDREAAATRRSLGLVSLEERVRAVGGRLTLATRPGNGTRIDVEVPIEEGADGPHDGASRG